MSSQVTEVGAPTRGTHSVSGRPADGRIIDLFAGAGGWDEGMAGVGFAALGIELDPWACATAEAAGHERLQADVSALDPAAFAPVWGLVASPPCESYSVAGKGAGRRDREQVIACAHELAAGNDTRAEHAERCEDPRSLLTVEPLRWTLVLRPRWLALEQVPAVLELWSLFAGLLAPSGYYTAAGVLSAEQFGVPQSRRRAFLIGSLDGPVTLPEPTHRSYNPRRPDEAAEDELHLAPWVAAGDALAIDRPATAVLHSGRRRYGYRRLDRPAATLTSHAQGWTIRPRRGNTRTGVRRG